MKYKGVFKKGKYADGEGEFQNNFIKMIYELKMFFKGILYDVNGKVEKKGFLKNGKYDGKGGVERNLMFSYELEFIFIGILYHSNG